MKAEMILAGTQFVAMVLSLAFLLRAKRLSVGLWSAALSHQCSTHRERLESIS
jgi:hypothetical protein